MTAPKSKPAVLTGTQVASGLRGVAAMTSVPEGRDVGTLLLPYQARIVLDESRLVVESKGRRQGGTESSAFEVAYTRAFRVRDCDAWFSSADESAAREFIERVKYWCGVFNAAFTPNGKELVDDKGFKVFDVRFNSGARVTAMTSNPKAFRSKGGDVYIDELAFHDDPEQMWAAALPTISMGYLVRVRSTPFSDTDFHWRLVEMGRRRRDPDKYGAPKPGDFPVSLHETYLPDAVAQGLVERINRIRKTKFTREQYVRELRSMMDQQTFDREYMGKPSSEANSLLPYTLTRPCCTADAALPTDNLATFRAQIEAAARTGAPLYGGVDIGRKHDRFVIWVLSRRGAGLHTAALLVWQGRSFAEMDAAGRTLFDAVRPGQGSHARACVRACVDATGMGTQTGEEWERRYGKYRVEALHITAQIKEEIYPLTRRHVEERTVTLPDDAVTLADLASVRAQPTAAGKIRYVADQSEHGHADRAFALALALHAADRGAPNPGPLAYKIGRQEVALI